MLAICGGSLYLHDAGVHGKYGAQQITKGAKSMRNTNTLSAPINTIGKQVVVLGWPSRPRETQLPG